MTEIMVISKETVDENTDTLIRKFKKKAIKDEVLVEFKKRQYFMSKREKRKFKQDMNIRRQKNKKYR